MHLHMMMAFKVWVNAPTPFQKKASHRTNLIWKPPEDCVPFLKTEDFP